MLASFWLNLICVASVEMISCLIWIKQIRFLPDTFINGFLPVLLRKKKSAKSKAASNHISVFCGQFSDWLVRVSKLYKWWLLFALFYSLSMFVSKRFRLGWFWRKKCIYFYYSCSREGSRTTVIFCMVMQVICYYEGLGKGKMLVLGQKSSQGLGGIMTLNAPARPLMSHLPLSIGLKFSHFLWLACSRGPIFTLLVIFWV